MGKIKMAATLDWKNIYESGITSFTTEPQNSKKQTIQICSHSKLVPVTSDDVALESRATSLVVLACAGSVATN